MRGMASWLSRALSAPGVRVVVYIGDVFEESADVAETEVARMAFVVKEDQAARPVGAAITGAVLTEALPGHLADEVEKARRRRGRKDGAKRLRGHAGILRVNVGGVGI